MFIYYPHFENKSVICGTTIKKEGGNYAVHTAESEKEKMQALQNRQALLKESGFKNLVTLKQTHSDVIHIIHSTNISHYSENPLIEGDALLTDLDSVLLGVLTADCVPLFYTDDSVSFCGIAHAGWKGLKLGIHMKMLHQIEEHFGIPPSKIQIIIGPHIRKCCYEVKKELIEEFGTSCFENRDSSCYLDMETIIRTSLVKSGASENSIFSHKACTKCSTFPRLYSYRNGDKKERVLSFIGKKELTYTE